jgi:hypothetical protein
MVVDRAVMDHVIQLDDAGAGGAQAQQLFVRRQVPSIGVTT